MADVNKKYITKQELSDGSVKEAISLTTETFIDQSFVFRKSAKTIGTDSLTLDKIKGRTLAWNQMADLTSPTANSASSTGITVTINSDGTLTLNGTSTDFVWVAYYPTELKLIAGHKYYYGGFIAEEFIWAQLVERPIGAPLDASTRPYIYTADSGQTAYIQIAIKDGYTVSNYKVAPTVVDLTLLYGSAIDGMTDEQILAKYESEFGTGYYPNNPGKLINNGKRVEYDLFWNQLVNPSTIFGNQSTTVTQITNGVSVTSVGNPIQPQNTIAGNYTAGNKFLVKLFISNTNDSFTDANNELVLFDNGSVGQRVYFKPVVGQNKIMFELNYNTSTLEIQYQLWFSGSTYSCNLTKIMLFDLTAMFGAGNEPATVEDFEALFPNDYYPYNAGTQTTFRFPEKNVKLETVGFNQWDEEWEVGDIEYGENHENDSRIRSKNYIPVISGATYFFHSSVNTWYEIYFYDGNKNYISFIDVYNETFVIPSGICYMRFYGSGAYPPPYNHDICINLSDPAKNGTYEPYKRVVLPLNLTDREVISPNIWDEEWENGKYDANDGSDVVGPDDIRSKNYIPVRGGASYCALYSGTLTLCYFDASKTFISGVLFNAQGGGIFTPPANAAYMKFSTTYTYTYGSTYANDICINESDPGHNGHYYPHGTFKPFPDGMRGAGTAFDYARRNKADRVMREVDMGNLEWSYQGNGRFIARGSSVPGIISSLSRVLVCSKYAFSDELSSSSVPDKSIANNSWFEVADVLVKDNDYTDADTFTAAMSGVKLIYEQAVPEEFDLVTPLPLSTFSGTIERRLPEDTENDVMAPFECDMTYGTNNEQILDIIDTKYVKPSGGIPASDLASGVIPTVPTISTDISSDASSNTKTTSPKAVKTYVDGICGDIETILATI